MTEKNSDLFMEISHVTRVCAPCLEHLGHLTLFDADRRESHLMAWCDTVFIPYLRPAILKTHNAQLNQGVREVLAIDTALEAVMAGPEAHRSRSAGRLAASDYHAPATERTLERYLSAVRSGTSPGHFAIVFAARAAVFHFSPQVTLTAYLFSEIWTAGWQEPWFAIGICLKRLPSTPTLLHAA